jgi:hypothetical protein
MGKMGRIRRGRRLRLGRGGVRNLVEGRGIVKRDIEIKFCFGEMKEEVWSVGGGERIRMEES